MLPGGETATDPDIKLCYTKRFSPVAGLHEAYVDGTPIGLFTSVRGVSEDTAYQLLRKLAMDRNRRIGEVASEVIAAAEVLI